MGIEPTCRLVTGTLVLKTRRPTRTPALPWKIIYYVRARLSMRKWKINDGPAVIPEIIDRSEKLPHHDNPVISALGRKGKDIAIFLNPTDNDEKKDLREEIPGGFYAMFSTQIVEIKSETEELHEKVIEQFFLETAIASRGDGKFTTFYSFNIVFYIKSVGIDAPAEIAD
jgi:hypothetical protein